MVTYNTSFYFTLRYVHVGIYKSYICISFPPELETLRLQSFSFVLFVKCKVPALYKQKVIATPNAIQSIKYKATII